MKRSHQTWQVQEGLETLDRADHQAALLFRPVVAETASRA
jgi:hypothetical protein